MQRHVVLARAGGGGKGRLGRRLVRLRWHRILESAVPALQRDPWLPVSGLGQAVIRARIDGEVYPSISRPWIDISSSGERVNVN